MSDNLNNNPYEAYFRSMMEMQQEMMKSYLAANQACEANGLPPMWPPHVNPAFGYPPMPGHFHHPMHHGMGFPGAMPPPPQWGPPPHAHQTPPPPPQPETTASDPLFEQAQAMLEGALGEEASTFNEILGSLV
ncbi:hypothetical protein [Vibrio sonorensis]|uniref:hypothetical protein n=1 Tax=Vibrio sonorensis TaxID=1004316 RepID=UPI001FE15957|nr:hypothetical protein [Vibrio sonorensis]